MGQNRRNENGVDKNGVKTDGKKFNGKNSGRPQQKNKFRPDNKFKNKNNRPHKPQEANGAVADSGQPNPSTMPVGKSSNADVAKIDPFELFCAYHLGIQPNNQYRPANMNEVAQRFGANPAIIKQASKEYGMDAAALLDKDFDMAMAQLDIQVAPEGINRKELAKSIYEEFLNAPIQKRDWKKILEEDQKENMKIFGR